jgi:endonuclease YncB( thermonuclease family)
MQYLSKILFFVSLFGLANGHKQSQYLNSSQILIIHKVNNQKQQKFVDGKVIKIQDGDTFTMIFDNGFEVKVRLNGIDSPEKKQPFSNIAKQTLAAMVFQKDVRVFYTSKDRYGRVLGDVFVDDINVNHEMLRKGMAWHFVKYSDDATLAKLEREARINKVGLWVDSNPIAPWDFRRN